MMFANAEAGAGSFAYMLSYVRGRLAAGVTPMQLLDSFNVNESFREEVDNGHIDDDVALSALLVRWVSRVQDVDLSHELVRAAILGEVDEVHQSSMPCIRQRRRWLHIASGTKF